MNFAMTDPTFLKLQSLHASYGRATQLIARQAPDAVIEFYGPVGEGFNGISAAQFAQVLDQVKDAPSLKVFLSSPGGDVFEGLSIANQLSRFAKSHDVTVVVDGLAASIASIVAISAPTVVMAPKAQMMIHEAWAPHASGSPAELRQVADRLEQATADMVDLYAKRTGKGAADIRAMLAQGDVYMTADQCVALGFADSIEGQQPPKAKPAALDPKRQTTAARINIEVRKQRKAASR